MSVITTIEAAVGDVCTTAAGCGYNGATCDEGVCGCDTGGGYRVEEGQCLPGDFILTFMSFNCFEFAYRIYKEELKID
jgi:hypothetical protein